MLDKLKSMRTAQKIQFHILKCPECFLIQQDALDRILENMKKHGIIKQEEEIKK